MKLNILVGNSGKKNAGSEMVLYFHKELTQHMKHIKGQRTGCALVEWGMD